MKGVKEVLKVFSVNPKEADAYIKVFKSVREEALSGAFTNSRNGVCGLIGASSLWASTSQLALLYCEEAWKHWEHYSGLSIFPVFDKSDNNNSKSPNSQYVYYLERHALWQGKQLELRLSLLDFLIRFTEEVKQEVEGIEE